MTLQEIINEMIKEIDRYITFKEVEVPTLAQTRTHRKKRINKKWKQRYGMKVIYKKKMAKVADVTIEDVIEFCREKNFPLPIELLNNSITIQND